MALRASLLQFAISLFSALQIIPLAEAASEPANRLLEEQRNARREQLLTDKALPAPTNDLIPALDSDPGALIESGVTLENPIIHVETHGLLPDGTVAAVLKPYRSLKIGQQRIKLLIRQLNASLVAAGWITSHAQLVTFDWRQARINIALIPGRIEKIVPQGIARGALDRVLPIHEGDVLALEALEQGVQQINRLRMYDATVQIRPGTAVGSSLLDIRLQETRPWRVSLGVDNQGQSTTGSGRIRLQGRLENTLGLFDDIQLAYLRSERSEALLASIAVPYGYSTWSATVTGSRSSPGLLGLDYTSRAVTATLGWNHVLHLSREGRDAVDITLTRAHSTRTLEGFHLTPERSTVARSSWVRIRRGPGYQYYVEPSLSLGLDAFDAIEDEDHLPRDHTHHQFTKLAFNAGLVARPQPAFEYATQFNAQRAVVSLIGAEQLTLGGLATVRGFEESVIAGDTGYLLRQELRLPQAFSQASLNPVPFVHLDAGTVWLKGATRHSLSSIGAGMRGTGPDLTWEGVLSFPLRHSEDIRRHPWRLHFQVAYEF